MKFRESLHVIFDGCSQAVLVARAAPRDLLAGKVTYVNDALCRLTGFAHREIEGKAVLSLIKMDEPAYVRKAEDSSQGTTNPVTLRFRHKSGSEIEASMGSWPIHPSAQGAGYIAFQQQPAPTQRILHSQDVGEQSNACIFTTDLEGTVTSWNRGAVRATGYTAEEMLGKDIRQVCGSPGSSCLPEDIIPILLKEGSFDFSSPVRKKDAGKTHLAFSLSLLRDGSGAPTGFLSVSVDVTELTRCEQALQESSELLDAIQRLQRRSMLGGDVRSLLEDALFILMEITGSEHGFCGEARKNSEGESYLKVDTIQTKSADPATRNFFQPYLNKGVVFRNHNSLIGRVFEHGEAVISDAPSSDPRAGGLPEGHPPLTCFAGLPLLTGKGMVGMVGLANRPTPYGPPLLLKIQPLLECCASLIEFCRARDHALYVAAMSERSFANTRDALVVTGLHGEIQDWNPAAEKLLGYRRDEAVGRSFIPMRPERSAGEFSAAVSEIQRKGYWEDTINLRSKAGVDVTVEASGHSTASDDAPRFMFVIRDVTWRKQAEEALREASLRFEAFAQNSRCGFWIGMPDGRSTYASPALRTITGLDASWDRERWDAMIHPDDYSSFCAARTRLHETGLPVRQKYRIILADGRVRWIESNSFPVRDPRGEIHRFAGLVEDVTEYEDAVAMMHQALSEKEALLKEIHHRVKNNLQIISSLLRLQATSTRDPEFIAFLQESRNRVETIALLHESLHQSENLSGVDFSIYLRRLVTRLMSMNASGEIIEVEFDIEPLTLDSQRTVLCGLILNELVSNCLRHAFREGPGKIRIEVKAASPRVISMSVSDNGVGLPPGFNPDQAATLGLRLVRRLARQLRGTATISNQTGVKVNVSFPWRNSQDNSAPESV